MFSSESSPTTFEEYMRTRRSSSPSVKIEGREGGMPSSAASSSSSSTPSRTDAEAPETTATIPVSVPPLFFTAYVPPAATTTATPPRPAPATKNAQDERASISAVPSFEEYMRSRNDYYDEKGGDIKGKGEGKSEGKGEGGTTTTTAIGAPFTCVS